MAENTGTPWPLVIEFGGRKYRRLVAPMALGGGTWEYLSRGKWYRVRSVFLKSDLNDRAKEIEKT
jgi:hypothetical protein